jgi:hypothetical protein
MPEGSKTQRNHRCESISRKAQAHPATAGRHRRSGTRQSMPSISIESWDELKITVPPVSQVIREISIANPLWGAPRIHGELLKLGIEVGQTSVAKYMVKRREPPSQGWRWQRASAYVCSCQAAEPNTAATSDW